MSGRLQLLGTALLVAAAMLQGAAAQTGTRTGKEVVDAVCASCHATGAQGAPRISDRKAWSRRASQGLTSLTQHALDGIRGMPAHGGSPDLSDLEIGRAVTYMVNRSGGNWIEPAGPAALAAERSGEQVVKLQCGKCHESGLGGAPKIGDRAAWSPRLTQGIDMAVRSAIRGHGGMPSRGGMADLTDGEIRAAVAYMFSQSGAAPSPGGAPRAAPAGSRKVVGGLEIYLGVMAAEALRAQHYGVDAESTMHRNIPRGKGYYHLNVSLFESGTQTPVSNAQVEARVANPLGGETKKLEAMVINQTVSYGNYFRMPGKESYTITLQIRRPGDAQPIEARFEQKRY